MKNTKADVIFKDFWRLNERFADIFNTVVFGGKAVIKPESLQEMDTDVSGVIQMKDYKETLARTRDVIRKAAYGVEFVILGIESQKHIHYAMPLRHMVYDAMGYLKEYQEMVRSCKENRKKVTEDEFLSKLGKYERLHPIVTLTVYYGEKSWDGPYCLKNMVVEMPKEIEAVFSDYKMNIMEVRDSGKYVFNNEDVQTVFEISRDTFAGHFDKIRNKYGTKNLSSEVLTVIGKIVGSDEIMSMVAKKEVDNVLCTALEKLKQEGVEEGLEQGIEQGIEQGKISVVINMLKNGITVEEIKKLTGVTDKEIIQAQNAVMK